MVILLGYVAARGVAAVPARGEQALDVHHGTVPLTTIR